MSPTNCTPPTTTTTARPSHPLCQHSMDDWKTVMHFLEHDCPTLRPKALVLLLQAMVAPVEVNRPDLVQKRWSGWLNYSRGHIFATPAALARLPSPAACASMARVLRAMIEQHFSTLAIGLLLHTATNDCIYSGNINAKVWMANVCKKMEALQMLIDRGLIRTSYETVQIGRTPSMRFHVTRSGKALLLGYFGKALSE